MKEVDCSKLSGIGHVVDSTSTCYMKDNYNHNGLPEFVVNSTPGKQLKMYWNSYGHLLESDSCQRDGWVEFNAIELN